MFRRVKRLAGPFHINQLLTSYMTGVDVSALPFSAVAREEVGCCGFQGGEDGRDLFYGDAVGAFCEA